MVHPRATRCSLKNIVVIVVILLSSTVAAIAQADRTTESIESPSMMVKNITISESPMNQTEIANRAVHFRVVDGNIELFYNISAFPKDEYVSKQQLKFPGDLGGFSDKFEVEGGFTILPNRSIRTGFQYGPKGSKNFGRKRSVGRWKIPLPQGYRFPLSEPQPKSLKKRELGDWQFCIQNTECNNRCCSNEYSNDGRFKCTPGGTRCTGLSALENGRIKYSEVHFSNRLTDIYTCSGQQVLNGAWNDCGRTFCKEETFQNNCEFYGSTGKSFSIINTKVKGTFSDLSDNVWGLRDGMVQLVIEQAKKFADESIYYDRNGNRASSPQYYSGCAEYVWANPGFCRRYASYLIHRLPARMKIFHSSNYGGALASMEWEVNATQSPFNCDRIVSFLSVAFSVVNPAAGMFLYSGVFLCDM